MLKKSKLKILSFLSLILLGACQTKIEYVPSDCLVIPAIQITQKDEETLAKYQEEFSFEFIKSLSDIKKIRAKQCQNSVKPQP